MMTASVKTILIADDEEDLRLLVQVTLENPSYQILTAVDGCSAVAAISSHIPDLLILDWMMPGLSGCEVVKILRQNPYLVKPFSPLELIQIVREVLA
ncbi:MAG: response regulator [Nitrospirales bacterium]